MQRKFGRSSELIVNRKNGDSSYHVEYHFGDVTLYLFMLKSVINLISALCFFSSTCNCRFYYHLRR